MAFFPLENILNLKTKKTLILIGLIPGIHENSTQLICSYFLFNSLLRYVLVVVVKIIFIVYSALKIGYILQFDSIIPPRGAELFRADVVQRTHFVSNILS